MTISLPHGLPHGLTSPEDWAHELFKPVEFVMLGVMLLVWFTEY